MRVKSEERRQVILDTARQLFTRKGFSDTSMSEIAKRVGGSKATLYNYFKSKEEIFAAVMESSATDNVAVAFDELSNNLPLADSLLQFGNKYLEFLFRPEIMAIHKMALHEADRSDIGRIFYEQGPKKGWLTVTTYLDTQIEKGAVRPCDSWVAAMHLRGLLESELLFPVMLGVLDRPDKAKIAEITGRAVTAFCTLYATE